MPDLDIVRLGPRRADYVATWELQRQLHADVVAGRRPGTVLLLEHEAVYTAGKRTEPHERPLDGTPVIDVDRGGKITWHGPGQLVGYPIVRLPAPINVVAHVRRLEEVMLRVCADLGLSTARVEGRSGLWVLADERGPDRKIGAIGVRVSRQVTMHGFALNCDCGLGWATTIIPCGIVGAGVTTLSAELGRDVTVDEVLPIAERHLVEVLGAVGLGAAGIGAAGVGAAGLGAAGLGAAGVGAAGVGAAGLGAAGVGAAGLGAAGVGAAAPAEPAGQGSHVPAR